MGPPPPGERRPGPRPRGDAAGRDRRPGGGGAAAAISPPTLRRPAPARRHRDGTDVRPGRADRGRAHHGAGRDDPGADPARADADGARTRRRDHPDHARFGARLPRGRPGGGDVRRPDRRDGVRGAALFATPRHPYTRGLLGALAVPGRLRPRERLPTIPGMVPPPVWSIGSCRFAGRCDLVADACMAGPVALRGDAHATRCIRA